MTIDVVIPGEWFGPWPTVLVEWRHEQQLHWQQQQCTLQHTTPTADGHSSSNIDGAGLSRVSEGRH